MIDVTQTGEGTVAGRYLRRFWHPVYVADKLPAGRVVPLTIMGQKLALYRSDDGAAHCVDNRCAHRGAMLSTGRVEGDMLRCPYHGWAYGPTGACRHQPFETAAYAQRIRIGAYAVREYLGLVYLYLGEGDPPEFPLFAELETASFRISTIEEIGCNWFQHVENSLDQAHLWIAHAPTPPTGTTPVTGLPKIAVQPTPWGICSTATVPGGKPRLLQFGMPNVAMYAILPDDIPGRKPDAEGVKPSWQLVLTYRVPIDDERHLDVSLIAVFTDPSQQEAAHAMWSRFESAAPGAHTTADKVLRGELSYADIASDCNFAPLAQDLVLLMAQGVTADRSRGVEHLGASDIGIVALRRLYGDELRALAAGGELRDFHRPDGLLPLTEASGVTM